MYDEIHAEITLSALDNTKCTCELYIITQISAVCIITLIHKFI